MTFIDNETPHSSLAPNMKSNTTVRAIRHFREHIYQCEYGSRKQIARVSEVIMANLIEVDVQAFNDDPDVIGRKRKGVWIVNTDSSAGASKLPGREP